MKCALLIIDMQVGFLDEYHDKTIIDSTIEYINYVSGMFRNAEQPVIHIQDVSEADTMLPEQLAISTKITQAPSDFYINKEFSNSFHQTTLSELLSKLQVDLIVLCGQAAEHCVVFTYSGASENGFPVVILQGGVASNNPSRIRALYEDRNLISHPVLRALFKSSS